MQPAIVDQRTASLPPSILKFLLEPELLQRRCWQFGTDAGVVHAPFLRLLEGGRLGGYHHPNEHFWRLADGCLQILDLAERVSTVFASVEIDTSGRLRFSGLYRDGIAVHVLQEREPLGQPADHTQLDLISRSQKRRKNLVVLRADENSVHGNWERDITDAERNWDLCISFYGKEESFPPNDFAEYAVLQNKERKFEAIKTLIHRDSFLWDYDYFIFPDDDLEMRWSDMNMLFAISREFDLHLAQPSLHPASFINYHNTKQDPKYLLRFVSMVEIMAPIFSKAALQACIHTFDFNRSAFGIDYVWSKIVEGPITKIAIIDKVAVLHGRPTGSRYDLSAYMAEGRQLSEQYGKWWISWIAEYGGILEWVVDRR